jgi:hypothetical protein
MAPRNLVPVSQTEFSSILRARIACCSSMIAAAAYVR